MAVSACFLLCSRRAGFAAAVGFSSGLGLHIWGFSLPSPAKNGSRLASSVRIKYCALQNGKPEQIIHQIDELNRREWDSWGIEFVTRKFDYGQKKDAFEEISRYLSALKGNTPRAWKAFDSVWADTHVHVGLEIPPTIAVSRPRVTRALQHLAYILTSYEDLLTQLRPIHRSGDGAEYYANRMISPTMRLEGETEELQAERTSKAASAAHRSHHELASNAEAVTRAAQRASSVGRIIWSDMRDTIFQEKLRIDSLVEMLHDSQAAGTTANRGFFVNWVNLSNYRWSETKDKPAKPTIEFRQHACSLDPGEMQHWVDLIFAVMRVSEAKAMQTTKFSGDLLDRNTSLADGEGSKCRINDQWRRGIIDAFCGSDLLDIHRVEMDC